MRLKRAAWLSSTALVLVSLSPIAKAQLLDQYIPSTNLGIGQAGITANDRDTAVGTTVLSRPHTDYDPLGIRLGSFNVNASGSESTGFDSNPLATSKSKSSPVNITSGSASIDSDWGRNGISARFNVNDYRYWDLKQENHTDWTAYLGGFVDIGRDRLQGSYQHLSLNVLPTGTDGVGFTQAVPFTDDELRINYKTDFGRFSFTPEVVYSQFRFDQNSNALQINGGGLSGFGNNLVGLQNVVQDQRINNRNVVTGDITAKYELSPGKNLVVVVQDSNAHFTTNLPGFQARDYNDIQALAGLDFQLLGPIRFRALAGLERRSYTNKTFKTTTTPTFEGQVIWTPTQLTTVTATVSRRIEDSVDAVTQNFTYTTGRLQVDHELRRNVVLSAFGQVQKAQYSSSQNATIYDVGSSVTYKLNRHVSLVGSYEYVHRDSDIANSRYNEHIVLATLHFAL